MESKNSGRGKCKKKVCIIFQGLHSYVTFYILSRRHIVSCDAKMQSRFGNKERLIFQYTTDKAGSPFLNCKTSPHTCSFTIGNRINWRHISEPICIVLTCKSLHAEFSNMHVSTLFTAICNIKINKVFWRVVLLF